VNWTRRLAWIERTTATAIRRRSDNASRDRAAPRRQPMADAPLRWR
jgi:hypothetical protein